jgi:predicted dehydrogenase
MGARILIVGCGQLGSRHLQAAISVDAVSAVDVVDPFPASLEMGRQRVEEVQDRRPGIAYTWSTDLAAASPNGDLCVVATQAAGRAALIAEIVEKLGYRAFLLEKIVTQSVAEYDSLLRLAETHGLSIWINCKTRVYPFHKRVKSLLDPAEPVVLTEVGGNHGLGNNGVHTADLFVFYDGGDRIDPVGSSIDQVLHPSKRGAQVFDLSGTMHGSTPKGSQLTITFQGSHVASPVTTIATSTYRCIVDQMHRWAWESDAASGWVWRPTPFEGDLSVSYMSRAFIGDILATGTCELPTLADCAPAHKFVLSTLLPHFQRLQSSDLDVCPIT